MCDTRMKKVKAVSGVADFDPAPPQGAKTTKHGYQI